MKAMIFAAGIGSRLRPFTLQHPKALAPVGGVEMLQRVILKLRDAGITYMVVNVHHFSEQVIEFLRQHDNFGVEIHVSDESELLLDTGGGLLAARRWLSDDQFVVHNADILCDFPLQEMIEAHQDQGALATLLVAERSTSRYLLMNDQLRMLGWTDVRTGLVRPDSLSAEKAHQLQKLAFGGVHILSPEIFPHLAAFASGERVFSIMQFYIAACSQLDLRGFMPKEPYKWLDIGKPQTLDEANRLFCD